MAFCSVFKHHQFPLMLREHACIGGGGYECNRTTCTHHHAEMSATQTTNVLLGNVLMSPACFSCGTFGFIYLLLHFDGF